MLKFYGSPQLAAVQQAFRAADEDPSVINPDFIRYWLAQGKTPAEIVAIACQTTLQVRRALQA